VALIALMDKVEALEEAAKGGGEAEAEASPRSWQDEVNGFLAMVQDFTDVGWAKRSVPIMSVPYPYGHGLRPLPILRVFQLKRSINGDPLIAVQVLRSRRHHTLNNCFSGHNA
jgi:hypothetical protein